MYNLLCVLILSMVIGPPNSGKAVDSETLARVRIGDKWGFADSTGKVVIDPIFDLTWGFSEGLAAVKVRDKWGYINPESEIVIKLKFDYVWSFSEGLAGVKIEDKYGYIDKSGELVIKPQFGLAGPFSEGLADVAIGHKRGYINREGKIVIKPQFDGAKSFREGLAAVAIGRKWGYIDRTGEMVIKPQFDYAQSFSKGLAMVQNEGSWRYIDKNGQHIMNTDGSGKNAMGGLPPPPSGVIEQRPELVHSVSPVYPKDAWKARLTGKVFLRFLVETDGRVSNVTVLGGKEVFRQAAIDALMQFRFKPAQIDGEPISVWMTQAISFNLK